MENVKDIISKNILFYRKKSGLSQKELANLLGVRNTAISNWENGANSIDIDTLFKLCKILNIDINTIFGYKNKPISEYTISENENNLIENYRKLDTAGKNTIEVVLKSQIERCEDEQKID